MHNSTKRVPAPGWMQQYIRLLSRQANLLVADLGYFLFLLALPLVLGVLPSVVPGHAGLAKSGSGAISGAAAGEPQSILALLIIGATFMGISMSIRDLVGERAIFQRERAVGLDPGAYFF